MTRNQNQYEQGFTVTELLVVFLIMVLMASLAIISWNKQTPTRNLTLAQNELVTNIRKVQSYAVSTKNLEGLSSANFYVMRFEVSSSQYEIFGVDSNGNVSAVLETVNLPSSIVFSEINSVNQVDGSITNPTCIFLIFNVIYGKSFIGGDEKCTNSYISSLVDDPPALARQANYDLGLSFQHSSTGQLKAVYIEGQTGRIQAYTPSKGKTP